MRGVVALSIVLCIGSVTAAQVVFTANDLERAMKIVGRNIVLLGAALEAHNYEGAKERIARAREQLSPTMGFWVNEKRTDAQQMVRAATARLDDLDGALSARPVDPDRVVKARKAVDAACASCHAVYREQDPVTKAFRLRR